MPQITKAEMQNLNRSIANNRLEFEIRAEIDNDGANPVVNSFNVSDNKHCVASYLDGTASNTVAAAVNTLVNMTDIEFRDAFGNYGREMTAKLIGKDPGTFDPSLAANQIVVNRVAFGSDVNRLGNNVHCFPVWINEATTRKCVELDQQEFDHFKRVTEFLFRVGEANISSQKAVAKRAWTAIGSKITGLAGADNELLSEHEINVLEIHLADGPSVSNGSADPSNEVPKPVKLGSLISKDAGQHKKFENQMGRHPGPDPNAKPFRGTG